MAYVARKSFFTNGHQYKVGEVVKNFPAAFPRWENFVHTGFVVEKAARKKPQEVKPKED